MCFLSVNFLFYVTRLAEIWLIKRSEPQTITDSPVLQISSSLLLSPCVSLSVVVCVISYGWHVGADQIHFHFFFLVLQRGRIGGAEMVSNRGNDGGGGGSRSIMVCILTYMVIWPRLLPSSPPPPPPSLLISMATSWTGTLLWSVPSLPSPFLFFLLPQKWYYYHYEICNSASVVAALRGGRSIKSRARGFYDNCPQEPSDWWLWDVPPPPKNPTPSKCTHEHCVHSQGREQCGGGGKMQSMGERKRGRNGRK